MGKCFVWYMYVQKKKGLHNYAEWIYMYTENEGGGVYGIVYILHSTCVYIMWYICTYSQEPMNSII